MTSRTATPPRHRPARRRPPGRVARVAADARVAWAVAMVLAAALGVMSVLYAPLAVAERDTERVEQVAAAAAARLTTFSAADMQAWVDDLSGLVTPRYAEEVAGLLDPSLRERMEATSSTSRGQVTDVFVQDLDRASATVFAVVRQTTAGAGGGASGGDEGGGDAEFTVRMTLTLRRTADGWRVDDVAVLGTPPQPVPLGR